MSRASSAKPLPFERPAAAPTVDGFAMASELNISDLMQKWADERDLLARFGCHVDGAKLLDTLLLDLAKVDRSLRSEVLTLPEAARESGYTVDHIGRLVREGRLTNAGRHHAPRVIRGELPTKRRQSIATPKGQAYDPDADARALLGRRGGR